jgi:ubiquinone/menaquinone biosynthesis C-methylase UbiE
VSLSKWRVRLQEYVVDAVLPKESTQVLDCGCGVGYGVVFAARSQGRSVVGVDASKTAIQHAIARVRQMDVQKAVDLIRCDVLSLPLRPGLFDAAFCVLLIDAFQDMERPFNEITNMVKHGGQLIVADLDPATLSMMTIGKIIRYLDRKSGHPYKLRKSTEIGEELSKLGFTKITGQRKHFGFSPPIYIVTAEKI